MIRYIKILEGEPLSFLVNSSSRYLPTVTVHSWGGFGSQLFAAHFVLRLKKKYPKRRIRIAVHTSGVTQRHTELNFSVIGIKSYEINDFAAKTESKEDSDTSANNSILSKVALRRIKFLLKKLHFIEDCNTEESFSLIKPWSIHFRGHYTQINLDWGVVKFLDEKYFKNIEIWNSNSDSLVIHYRLGDLLTLNDKSPIEAKRVESLLIQQQLQSFSKIVLTESSPEKYREFVAGCNILSSLEAKNVEVFDLMRICISANVFIGTGTKLAIWAVIFRNIRSNVSNFLPKELYWARRLGLETFWY